MKRNTNDCGWDEPIPEPVQEMLRETKNMLAEKDPVCGLWSVCNMERCTIWCDASNLAIGVSVEIDEQQVEKGHHINFAELDEVIRGISCGRIET